jgi:hypothetical protein
MNDPLIVDLEPEEVFFLTALLEVDLDNPNCPKAAKSIFSEILSAIKEGALTQISLEQFEKGVALARVVCRKPGTFRNVVCRHLTTKLKEACRQQMISLQFDCEEDQAEARWRDLFHFE